MTRVRIVHLVVLFALAAAGIGLALSHLMVVRHDEWLARSYRNRWVFRDVPTRRGSILDRHGAQISADAPANDVELRYRAFRREHPVGLAVSGANRLLEVAEPGPNAAGDVLADPFRFDEPERIEAACDMVLSMPVALLDDDTAAGIDAESARDLRFYAGALLAELTSVRASSLYRALRDAARDGRNARAIDVALEVCADLERAGVASADGAAPRFERARFSSSLAELHRLAARLTTERQGGAPFDLWAFLEERRLAAESWRAFERLLDEPLRRVALDPAFWEWSARRSEALVDWRDLADLAPESADAVLREFGSLDETARRALRDAAANRPAERRLPWNEDIPRPMLRQIHHEQAVWLELMADRHPGFAVRPSVRRVTGNLPGHDDLGSLGVLLGQVTSLWRTDLDGDEEASSWQELAASLGERGLDEFFRQWPSELPEPLDEMLETSARETIYAHYLARGRIGRGGIESAIDDRLSGVPGLRFVERDRRREQRLLDSLDVRAGQDVVLTLDLDLQAVVEDALAATDLGAERAAVFLDARTGDILAIAGWPLVTEDGKPRALSAALYPQTLPFVGSVAKPFVALEHLDALRRGRAHRAPGEFTACAGNYPGTKLRCGHVHGEAARDAVYAIGHSCNIWFFHATEGLTADGLRRAYARIGWMPGAIAPVDPRYTTSIAGLPDAYVARPRLTEYRFQMQGIGYGVQVNAAFVARAYAALATGVLPSLGLLRDRPHSSHALDVDPADLEIVRLGLLDCVTTGTAREHGWREFDVLGKTGTAEIRTVGERRNNAWFAGYAQPAGDGREGAVQLAFAVVLYDVEHGRGGGGVAAPIAADVFARLAASEVLAERYLPTSAQRRTR